MVFTWNDLFNCLSIMWELNHADIAKYLVVSPSTISRLASGDQKRFEKKSIEIYKDLFDPSNTNIPANGIDEKQLLANFVEVIIDEGFEDVIKDIKYDNYESLVMGLLKAAKDAQPPKKKQNAQKTESLPHSKRGASIQEESKPIWRRNMDEHNMTLSDETTTDARIVAFKQAVADYNIAEFMKNGSAKIRYDPNGFQREVRGFIKIVNAAILPMLVKQGASDSVYCVHQFCTLLEEYRKYIDDNYAFWGDRRFLEQSAKYEAKISMAYRSVTGEILFLRIIDD